MRDRLRDRRQLVERWQRRYRDSPFEIVFGYHNPTFGSNVPDDEFADFLKDFKIDYPIYHTEVHGHDFVPATLDIAVVKASGEWTYIGEPEREGAEEAVKAMMEP